MNRFKKPAFLKVFEREEEKEDKPLLIVSSDAFDSPIPDGKGLLPGVVVPAASPSPASSSSPRRSSSHHRHSSNSPSFIPASPPKPPPPRPDEPPLFSNNKNNSPLSSPRSGGGHHKQQQRPTSESSKFSSNNNNNNASATSTETSGHHRRRRPLRAPSGLGNVAAALAASDETGDDDNDDDDNDPNCIGEFIEDEGSRREPPGKREPLGGERAKYESEEEEEKQEITEQSQTYHDDDEEEGEEEDPNLSATRMSDGLDRQVMSHSSNGEDSDNSRHYPPQQQLLHAPRSVSKSDDSDVTSLAMEDIGLMESEASENHQEDEDDGPDENANNATLDDNDDQDGGQDDRSSSSHHHNSSKSFHMPYGIATTANEKNVPPKRKLSSGHAGHTTPSSRQQQQHHRSSKHSHQRRSHSKDHHNRSASSLGRGSLSRSRSSEDQRLTLTSASEHYYDRRAASGGKALMGVPHHSSHHHHHQHSLRSLRSNEEDSSTTETEEWGESSSGRNHQSNNSGRLSHAPALAAAPMDNTGSQTPAATTTSSSSSLATTPKESSRLRDRASRLLNVFKGKGERDDSNSNKAPSTPKVEAHVKKVGGGEFAKSFAQLTLEALPYTGSDHHNQTSTAAADPTTVMNRRAKSMAPELLGELLDKSERDGSGHSDENENKGAEEMQEDELERGDDENHRKLNNKKDEGNDAGKKDQKMKESYKEGNVARRSKILDGVEDVSESISDNNENGMASSKLARMDQMANKTESSKSVGTDGTESEHSKELHPRTPSDVTSSSPAPRLLKKLMGTASDGTKKSKSKRRHKSAEQLMPTQSEPDTKEAPEKRAEKALRDRMKKKEEQANAATPPPSEHFKEKESEESSRRGRDDMNNHHDGTRSDGHHHHYRHHHSDGSAQHNGGQETTSTLSGSPKAERRHFGRPGMGRSNRKLGADREMPNFASDGSPRRERKDRIGESSRKLKAGAASGTRLKKSASDRNLVKNSVISEEVSPRRADSVDDIVLKSPVLTSPRILERLTQLTLPTDPYIDADKEKDANERDNVKESSRGASSRRLNGTRQHSHRNLDGRGMKNRPSSSRRRSRADLTATEHRISNSPKQKDEDASLERQSTHGHGNLPSLDEQLSSLGSTQFVWQGDELGDGAFPRETHFDSVAAINFDPSSTHSSPVVCPSGLSTTHEEPDSEKVDEQKGSNKDEQVLENDPKHMKYSMHQSAFQSDVSPETTEGLLPNIPVSPAGDQTPARPPFDDGARLSPEISHRKSQNNVQSSPGPGLPLGSPRTGKAGIKSRLSSPSKATSLRRRQQRRASTSASNPVSTSNMTSEIRWSRNAPTTTLQDAEKRKQRSSRRASIGAVDVSSSNSRGNTNIGRRRQSLSRPDLSHQPDTAEVERKADEEQLLKVDLTKGTSRQSLRLVNKALPAEQSPAQVLHVEVSKGFAMALEGSPQEALSRSGESDAGNNESHDKQDCVEPTSMFSVQAECLSPENDKTALAENRRPQASYVNVNEAATEMNSDDSKTAPLDDEQKGGSSVNALELSVAAMPEKAATVVGEAQQIDSMYKVVAEKSIRFDNEQDEASTLQDSQMNSSDIQETTIQLHDSYLQVSSDNLLEQFPAETDAEPDLLNEKGPQKNKTKVSTANIGNGESVEEELSRLRFELAESKFRRNESLLEVVQIGMELSMLKDKVDTLERRLYSTRR